MMATLAKHIELSQISKNFLNTLCTAIASGIVTILIGATYFYYDTLSHFKTIDSQLNQLKDLTKQDSDNFKDLLKQLFEEQKEGIIRDNAQRERILRLEIIQGQLKQKLGGF